MSERHASCRDRLDVHDQRRNGILWDYACLIPFTGDGTESKLHSMIPDFPCTFRGVHLDVSRGVFVNQNCTLVIDEDDDSFVFTVEVVASIDWARFWH